MPSDLTCSQCESSLTRMTNYGEDDLPLCPSCWYALIEDRPRQSLSMAEHVANAGEYFEVMEAADAQ